MACTFYDFFFFNATATAEIYTLSLHDALPISLLGLKRESERRGSVQRNRLERKLPTHAFCAAGQCICDLRRKDRKSTRLNSSHTVISYAVFCLKKKKRRKTIHIT